MKQDIICEAPLSEEKLSQAVSEFYRFVRPERERLFDYYRGQQPIPKGEAVRGRPNNHLHIPFPRYITEVQTGYFLGLPLTMSFPRPETSGAFSRLSKTLGLDHLLFDTARDMSICGVGFILVWLERSGLRACRCDPLSCFAIRSGEAGSPLLGTVRLYDSGGGTVRGILYQENALQPFLWDGHQVSLLAPEENLLGTLSLLPFANNCQGCGDFEPVMGLVDAYNLLLSGALDDMQSVANAFLAIYGLQGTTQSDIEEANRSRVLCLHESGRAEFVVKDLNHEALAHLESNLRRSILQLSMTPDLSDESFAGSASGVALRYKLWGVEQVRSAKERSFTEGLAALLVAFSAGLRVLGTPAELAEGIPTFYKNLPRDHGELAETLLSLSPVLSRRTILENLPWVTDVDEELRRKSAEDENKED